MCRRCQVAVDAVVSASIGLSALCLALGYERIPHKLKKRIGAALSRSCNVPHCAVISDRGLLWLSCTKQERRGSFCMHSQIILR